MTRLSCLQVRVLMEEGHADFEVRDRWALDPLDEAMRERREPVVKLLQQSGALDRRLLRNIECTCSREQVGLLECRFHDLLFVI